MKNKSVYGVIAAVLLSFGVASAWAEGDKVDCSTANDDIATLQGEKEKVKAQKKMGLFSITPIGMVVGAATSADGKAQVDEYNEKLDAHIAKIKSACGID